MSVLAESDWRKLRTIRERALARFCGSALRDLKAMVDSADRETDPHATHLAVSTHAHAQDARLSELLEDWRRAPSWRGRARAPRVPRAPA
jgi:hypothetical protein